MDIINKDLVIIGAGPGGYELAINANKKGINVTLIEKNKLGGTCLNYGCIPTKTYFQRAKVLEQTQKMFNQELNINFKDIYDFKNKLVSDLIEGINLELKGVEVIYGEAKLFTKDNKVLVKVNEEVLNPNNLVIATGSMDCYLDIEGIDLTINSKELLDLDYLPSSISIIGGGVIGMEMASIYNALGVEINVFEYYPTILPRFDKEVARRLQNLLKAKGVKFYTSANVEKISKENGLLKLEASINSKEEVVYSEVILSATGRVANIWSLGLEDTNIKYDTRGIKVDKFNETNVSNVYAIGDCTGGIMLAHKATFDGNNVLNKLLNKKASINFDNIPACCFTIPEVASIGLSEEEAKQKYNEASIRKQMYRSNGKARATCEVDGFVKLVIANDLIVGASIIGEEANLLIHETMVLMNAKVKLSKAQGFIHAHPTLAEIIQSAMS